MNKDKLFGKYDVAIGKKSNIVKNALYGFVYLNNSTAGIDLGYAEE